MLHSTPDIIAEPGQAVTGVVLPQGQAPMSGQQVFGEILRQQSELKTPQMPDAEATGPAREAQANQAAGDLISNALILPMLKQLRRSPWSENTVFAPGIGEKTFGPQFDMQISDRIAHNPRLGLKAALAQRLLKQGPAVGAPNTDPGAALTTHARLDLHG